MITPDEVSNPSISASNWFRVCSRSSLVKSTPRPDARDLPIASSSSMKMMHGARLFARSKRSRTRAAPTPTKISMNSEPEIEKNGTFASPATAFASSVFPVPGGPTRRTPFVILPPSFVYLCGFFRKSSDIGERDIAVSVLVINLGPAFSNAGKAALRCTRSCHPHVKEYDHQNWKQPCHKTTPPTCGLRLRDYFNM